MAPGYRASKNPDGTWNIHDVPIFASNKLRKVEGTRDWQERAVAKAQERCRAVGHIPPLHENHTGGSAKVRNLGFMVPTRVGTPGVPAPRLTKRADPRLRKSPAE